MLRKPKSPVRLCCRHYHWFPPPPLPLSLSRRPSPHPMSASSLYCPSVRRHSPYVGSSASPGCCLLSYHCQNTHTQKFTLKAVLDQSPVPYCVWLSTIHTRTHARTHTQYLYCLPCIDRPPSPILTCRAHNIVIWKLIWCALSCCCQRHAHTHTQTIQSLCWLKYITEDRNKWHGLVVNLAQEATLR